jgi:hypothetical protein
MIQHQSSTQSSPIHSNLNLLSRSIENKHDLLTSNSSNSSSTDSLTALEEILQRQETRHSSTFLPQKVNHTNFIFVILRSPGR